MSQQCIDDLFPLLPDTSLAQTVLAKMHALTLRSSCFGCSLKLSGFVGHCFSGIIRNCGPDIHPLRMTLLQVPWKQGLHSCIKVFTYCISELDFFQDKGFWDGVSNQSGGLVFFMYFSTEVLSMLAAATTAAVSSNVEKVGFRGANLAFPMIKTLHICALVLYNS